MATTFWAEDFSDIALTQIKNTVDTLYLCSQEPTSYYEATVTYKLGSVGVSSSDFTGPTSGIISGRKIVLASMTISVPTANGTATYISLIDSINAVVRHQKRCNSTPVVTTSAVVLDQYLIEIRDP